VLVIQGEAITGQKEVIVTAYAQGKGIAPAESMLVSTLDEWRGVLVAGVDDLAKNAIAAMKPPR
jgi:UDP-N-acetylmuramate-alanine ligase